MYIIYWVSSATKEGQVFFAGSNRHFALLGPSECIWIIPGTMGVDD